MLSFSAGLALSCLLGLGPAGQATPPRFSVAVMPLSAASTDRADLSPTQVREVSRAIAASLEHERIRVTELEVGDAASRCEDALCRSRTLSARGVTHALSVEITGGDRMYEVDVTLRDVATGSEVATSGDTCSVCGWSDLRELVAAEAEPMRTWLVQTATLPASLDVEVSPSNARIRVDGELVGRGTLRAKLPPGPHEVVIEAPGHRPHAETINLMPGHARDLDVDLSAAKRPWLRPLSIGAIVAGVTATSAGAALVAIHGREHRSRCSGPPEVDADGDCRYVHRTLAPGLVSLLGGLGLSATGVTLLVIGRGEAELGVAASHREVMISGRF
ncbi:MAG: PEGA domain-containing protein [Nannocystaceae bacterium]|nr:PEGA domain-containing protein [bacterium]